MKGLLADCRHALRLYWRTPGASLIAVAVLAIGMAFVSAFLSLYVDLVLRPHPGFEDSGSIVTIGQLDGVRFTGIPLGLIERMAEEVAALESAAGLQATSMPIGPDRDNRIVELVSGEFFAGIRPKLALGRGFEQADHDPDAEPVAVISDAYWREAFDASPDVIGMTLDFIREPTQRISVVNGRAEVEQDEASDEDLIEVKIVGVMAPEMPGVMIDSIGLWVPLERFYSMIAGSQVSLETIRAQWQMRTLARLRPGASLAALTLELQTRYPESTEDFRLQSGFQLDAVGGVVRDINVHRDARRQLQLFLGASVLLALVAAANVSLFLLARAPGRRRELAIRLSVGAPLRRLARQLASEAGLLVVISAALGLLLSVWLVNVLRGLAFLRQAEWSNVTLLDWRVLSLVGIFLLILSLLVSLAPIVGLRRLGIAASSRQIAARATFAQRVAGTLQIAIAGALGGAAIAFGMYLGSMVLGDPGYATQDRYQVQFLPFILNQTGGSGRIVVSGLITSAVDATRQREVIETLPGVRGVSFTSVVPGSQTTLSTRTIRDPVDPRQELSLAVGNIDGRFVDLLGLRLLYGRSPDDGETGVALVNQSLARRIFGRDDVVGEILENVEGNRSLTEIVGVLEDLSYVHPAAEVDPMVFLMAPPMAFSIRGVIESPLPAAELQQQLQGLIDSGELELGQPNVRPLADLRNNLIAPDTARSLLTIATAGLVVLLAAFGFYGTQRYLVTAGRREYAIRASLGAGPRALEKLVFGRGLLLSLPGLVLGAILAFIVVAWLRDDFVSRDIGPGFVTLCVVAGLSVLLLAASFGPARQARSTQPAPLLRED